MSASKLTWIGLLVEDCLIESELSEGGFSWVFKGNPLDGGEPRVFKVAKTVEFIERGGGDGDADTQALALLSGSVMSVKPDGLHLLRAQSEKLLETDDSALVTPFQLIDHEGTCYLSMEYLDGSNLRDVIKAGGGVALSVLIDLASAMDRLSAMPTFKVHGDLKPENLIVTTGGVKIIDPGFFGSIQTDKGEVGNCAITTRLYYPSLQPDDLYAFGLILWEIAVGIHPLRLPEVRSTPDKRIGPDLLDFINFQEVISRFDYEGLSNLQLPSQLRPGIPKEVEHFVLKALRLRKLPDGRIESDSGFSSFAEISEALMTLAKSGIHSL